MVGIFEDFLDWEREIVLKYLYYMRPCEPAPLWVPLDSILRENQRKSSPPKSSRKGEIILLFRDESESFFALHKITKQDPDVLALCPHQAHRCRCGSVFVLPERNWKALERFLDLLAGVVSLNPEVYQHVTPMVMKTTPKEKVVFRYSGTPKFNTL